MTPPRYNIPEGHSYLATNNGGQIPTDYMMDCTDKSLEEKDLGDCERGWGGGGGVGTTTTI